MSVFDKLYWCISVDKEGNRYWTIESVDKDKFSVELSEQELLEFIRDGVARTVGVLAGHRITITRKNKKKKDSHDETK